MQAFEAAVRAAFTAAGHESRYAFLRLRRADGALRLETDAAAWLESAWPNLAPVAPEPIERVMLPMESLRGQSAWVGASVAEVRREPRHESEQITQALQGEVLVPLLHEDGWLLGRLPDGYVGWVRDWHLRVVAAAEPLAFAARANHRIGTSWSSILCAPRADADPCGETIMGTHVVVHAQDGGWSQVELPGGKSGWLPQMALRAGAGPWPGDVASLLATLRRFLGVPYLWGGRSPKGFDCSGLVQFAYGLHGFDLPRDADAQAGAGYAVETAAAGDLHFFGKDHVTHVAVALDAERFLHARGEVRCNALRRESSLHDAELRALWRGTRRVLRPAH